MEKIWILSLTASLAWVFVVMLAMAGIGGWVLRRLRHPAGWIAGFAIGLSLVVALGGWLNFLHGIRTPVVVVIVAVGVVLAGMKLGREGLPQVALFQVGEARQAWVVMLFVCGFAVIAFRILATVHRVNYHPVDDLNEYLVFPQRMLQQHFFAADPFSERRLINSVGPTYFVQALVVAVLPLTHLQMADETIGQLLMVACLLVMARRWRLPAWATGVALLVSFVGIQSTFNLSFSVLPGALLLAVVLMATEEGLSCGATEVGVLLGAASGVVSGLKTTYLPHAALLVLFLCVARSKSGWGDAVRGWIGGLIGFLIVLGPWMIAMRRTSGTFLYPLFGQGVHYPRYYTMDKMVWKAHSVHDVVNLVWLLPVLVLLLWMVRGPERVAVRATCAFLGATTLAAVVMAVGTAGDSVMRYNMPCLFPALVVAFLMLAAEYAGEKKTVLAIGAVYTVMLLVVLCGVMAKTIVQAEGMPLQQAGVLRRDFVAAFHAGVLPEEARRGDYEAMEAAIPVGQKTLGVLAVPYYLDFSQREIFLSELTAAASPAPGWPIHGSGEDLARYLRGQSIRYLAYSYADGAGAPDKDLHTVLASAWTTTIVRNEMLLELEAHRQFGELAATHKHVYDDGRMYLLDLDKVR